MAVSRCAPPSYGFCNFLNLDYPFSLDWNFVMLKKIFLSLSLALSIVVAAPVMAKGSRGFAPDQLERIKERLEDMYRSSPPAQRAKIRMVTAKWNALSHQQKRATIKRLRMLREAHENLDT